MPNILATVLQNIKDMAARNTDAFFPKRGQLRSTAKHSIGHRYEQLAAIDLRARGYTILKSNLRLKFGEIDLVASRKDHLLLVEVRSILKGAYVPSRFLPLAKVHRLHRLARVLGQLEKRTVRIELYEFIGKAPFWILVIGLFPKLLRQILPRVGIAMKRFSLS